MVRPRDRFVGRLGAPEVAGRGGGGGGGGRLGGGGLGGFAEPIGLPPELAAPLGDLDALVKGQVAAEQKLGLPKGFVPSALTPEMSVGIAARAKRIQEAVPGIPGSVVAQYAASDMDIDQSIRLAKAAFRDNTPKSWWKHVPGIEPVGKALHATFIAAPEWLWRHTVVDAFQEVGELVGVHPELAQRMSPGQIAVAGVARIEDENDERGLWRNGELVDPEDWDGAWKLASGGLDFLARITLDPTMLLGKARTGLIIGEGALGLKYVRGGAGASQRVARLRELADLNPERAYKVGRSIIDGGRGQTMVNFLFGNANLSDIARSVVTGHTGARRFVDDIVDLRNDPTMAAEILKRYGAPRRGWGLRAEHVALLEEVAKKAKDRKTAFKDVEEAVVSMVTGRFTPHTKEMLGEVTKRWNEAVAFRHDAARRWQALRAEAVGEGSTETRIVPGAPRVDGRGRVRYPGEGRVSPEVGLATIEIGASRQRAFNGDGPRAGVFDQQAREWVRTHLDEADEAVKKRFDELDEEIAGVGDELKPFVDVWQADPAERRRIIGDMLELRDEMGVNLPMAEFPAEALLGIRVPGLGGKPLRELPVFNAFNFTPHRVINVHDPYWHDQMQRLARRAGMDEDEITAWINRVLQDGRTPQATAGIMREFVQHTYEKVGLSADEVEELMSTTSKASQKLYAVVKGKKIDRPLYSSQELNVALLTNPKVFRAMQRVVRSRKGAIGQTVGRTALSFTDALDSVNQVFKRLMVSSPRTGLRVLLEGQARALAYGFSNIYKNPLIALAVLPMSVFAPGLAQKTAVRLSPKHLREMAMKSGDMGFSGMLYEAGLLSANAHRENQVLRWRDMKGSISKHNFRKAQANYINDFLLNDELVRRVMFESDDGARAWLKSGAADAEEYRSRLEHLRRANDKNFDAVMDRHFDDIRTNMNELGLDDENLRGIVTGLNPGRVSQIRPRDLLGLEAQEIVGSSIWKTDGSFLNKILDTVVNRHLGSIEYIGRDFTTRRELHREVWRRVSHAEGAGQKVDHAAVKRFLAGGAVEKGHGIEHALVQGARRDVHQKVKWLFFDLAEQSRFAEAFRFVFPFGNAYQEVVQTWGRILVERPWVPHLASAMVNNVDEIPGLTFTDPATGEKMFRIPLSQHMLRFAGVRGVPDLMTGVGGEDLAYELQGRLSGFNLVSSGLPIPGPFAQIPLRTILKNKPGLDAVFQTLFPYGDTDLVDSFQPGFVRQFRAAVAPFLNQEESNVEFASLLSDLVAEEYFRILNDLPKTKEGHVDFERIEDMPGLDRIDTDALVGKAQKIFAIKTAARVFFPAAVKERSPFKEDIDFYRYLAEIDPRMADQVFLSKTGSPAYKALVSSETDLWPDAPAMPPTKKARELIIKSEPFRDFVESFGQAGWDIFHESWTGELDYDTIRDQLQRGDRRRRTSEERVRAVQQTVGWDYYFQYNDALESKMNALGLANFSQKGAEQFKAAKNEFLMRMMQVFPEWAKDYDTRGGSRSRSNEIAKLAVMANIPELQRLDAVQGLREYFARRAELADLMRAYDIGSLGSKKALNLKAQWSVAQREIIARHPHFARIWGRYLERDNPAESLRNQPGEDGTVKIGILNRSGLLNQDNIRRALELGLVN